MKIITEYDTSNIEPSDKIMHIISQYCLTELEKECKTIEAKFGKSTFSIKSQKIISPGVDQHSESLSTFLILFYDISDYEQLAREKYSTAFFTSITHELRTPLNSIEGAFEMLKEYVNEGGQCFYTVCKRSLIILNYLIKDTLMLAKMERGTVQAMIKPFKLSDMMKSLCSFFQFEIDLKSLKLNLCYDDRIPSYMLY